jgi:hypothetical protein
MNTKIQKMIEILKLIQTENRMYWLRVMVSLNDISKAEAGLIACKMDIN